MANLFKNVLSPTIWNRQPVFMKSTTTIDQIANWYWPNHQMVLAKSPTSIGQIANPYWPKHQPVLAKSPTRIGQIVYWYTALEVDLKKNYAHSGDYHWLVYVTKRNCKNCFSKIWPGLFLNLRLFYTKYKSVGN